ncbi:hypothetical protein N658DRAFT_510705 [Parathielavia hyrcaniae]|uniref:Uncharacterized protein n=1 Tax=Parathielavia hyrcaniae TaxID=113614 RepID=A0AAN6SY42_9PEZI|nr:hypothetical protein N658DRAFT_510705 [Parathielavia hyrcaniae]
MGEAPVASLRAIVVPRDMEKRHIVLMDRSVFLTLFDTLGLDEYALYLYLTNVPGLYYLVHRPTTTSSPQAGNSGALGFYLNTVHYTLIWSYSPETQAVNVLVLGRANAPFETDPLVRPMQTKQPIVFNPLYPAFVACFQGFLRNWDAEAGFRPRLPASVVQKRTMELDNDSKKGMTQFSEACLCLGSSLTESEKNLRELQTVQEIAKQLDPTSSSSLWDRIQHVHGDNNNDMLQQSTIEIQTAMPSLQSQLASRIAHFEWEMRWADVNLRLATARMQRTEACLAKQDSQTMVSIAYTTMFFLPATFLAALFDMEATTELMKSDFTFYWKLAVPVTALVLLFWDVTRDRVIERRVLGPAKKRWV